MAALQWETLRHQVAIAGNVVNAVTGLAMPGAVVKIDAGTIQANTLTAQDGHFHFLDLPDGSYPVRASMPTAGSRHGSAQVNATVSRDGSGNIQMATADIQLPATTIRGEISKPDHSPVVMAEIQLAGSGERVFTDSDGRYALVGIEIGTRTLTVTRQTFETHVQTVSIAAAGDTVTVDVTLIPS